MSASERRSCALAGAPFPHRSIQPSCRFPTARATRAPATGIGWGQFSSFAPRGSSVFSARIWLGTPFATLTSSVAARTRS